MFNRTGGSRLAGFSGRANPTNFAAANQSGFALATTHSSGDAMPVLYAMAAAAAPLTASGDSQRHGFWLTGLAGGGRLDLSAGSGGSATLRTIGAVSGYDFQLTPSLTLGIMGAHFSSTLESNLPASHDERTAWIAGAYGRLQHGAMYTEAQAGYGFDSIDTERQITIGPLSRTAKGDFSGRTGNARLEFGYGIGANHALEPYVSAQWLGQRQDAHTESGAGALNLRIDEQRSDSLRSTLGIRFHYQSDAAQGKRAEVVLHAAWAHEWATPNATTASFSGDITGTRFLVQGARLNRDSVLLGGGVTYHIKDNLRLFGNIDGDFDRDQRTVSFSGGLRVHW